MIDFVQNLNPVAQTLIATTFTWGMTALGAGVVFMAKDMSRRMLDCMLGFAAGAMLFVVVEDIIPESQYGGNTDLATTGAMIGFVLMMVLDVAFG